MCWLTNMELNTSVMDGVFFCFFSFYLLTKTIDLLMSAFLNSHHDQRWHVCDLIHSKDTKFAAHIYHHGHSLTLAPFQ